MFWLLGVLVNDGGAKIENVVCYKIKTLTNDGNNNNNNNDHSNNKNDEDVNNDASNNNSNNTDDVPFTTSLAVCVTLPTLFSARQV